MAMLGKFKVRGVIIREPGVVEEKGKDNRVFNNYKVPLNILPETYGDKSFTLELPVFRSKAQGDAIRDQITKFVIRNEENLKKENAFVEFDIGVTKMENSSNGALLAIVGFDNTVHYAEGAQAELVMIARKVGESTDTSENDK